MTHSVTNEGLVEKSWQLHIRGLLVAAGRCWLVAVPGQPTARWS